MSDATPTHMDRLQRGVLAVAVVALLLLIISAFFSLDVFFESYLVGYLYWWGITLGSGAIIMIHQLTGGRWGTAINGVLESSLRNIILLAALFVPVLLGLGRLYHWVGESETLGSKAAYLNVPFFVIRTVLYFVLWAIGGVLLVRWAIQRRTQPDTGGTDRLMALSAGGLILYVLTVTFAAIDWIMAIDAHWFSSIFGLLIVIGQLLASLCLAIVVVLLTARTRGAPLAINTLHDLGNLLLACVSLWAYIQFSQFLIIWYGNLPEEIVWYVPRTRGAWGVVAVVLILLHFAVPLIVLLARQSKRQPTIMLAAAFGLLVLHAVDLLWIVVPSFHRDTGWPILMDLIAIVGVGCVWLFFFMGYLRQYRSGADTGEGVSQTHG